LKKVILICILHYHLTLQYTISIWVIVGEVAMHGFSRCIC